MTTAGLSAAGPPHALGPVVRTGAMPVPPPPPVEENPFTDELYFHLGSTLNELTRVGAVDDPDQSDGANHEYEIHTDLQNGTLIVSTIRFQHGGMNVVGPNGITEESLLAILLHRLDAFQNGRYACRENAQARSRVQEALMWLKERTARRIAEGVEGQREKG